MTCTNLIVRHYQEKLSDVTCDMHVPDSLIITTIVASNSSTKIDALIPMIRARLSFILFLVAVESETRSGFSPKLQ
jgi:hypothetical protein